MIKIQNLYKSWGDVKALVDINLHIKEGEIFGLIGPDGAGKTSLFDILTTLSDMDKGNATIDEKDVSTEHLYIRSHIGYMPGKFSLYQDLTVRENIDFFANIFRTSLEKSYEFIRDIWIQIEPFSKRPAGKLSGGMKQKLALCCALIHQPRVLFLDEPTTGVDPVSRREFWQLLKGLQNKGITIVASTPYMDEAVLCDRIALIQHGEIMACDSPNTIIQQYPNTLLSIKGASTYHLQKIFLSMPGIASCYAFGQSVHVTLEKETDMEEVRKKIDNSLEVKKITPSIEDCFISLMTSKK